MAGGVSVFVCSGVCWCLSSFKHDTSHHSIENAWNNNSMGTSRETNLLLRLGLFKFYSIFKERDALKICYTVSFIRNLNAGTFLPFSHPQSCDIKRTFWLVVRCTCTWAQRRQRCIESESEWDIESERNCNLSPKASKLCAFFFHKSFAMNGDKKTTGFVSVFVFEENVISNA